MDYCTCDHQAAEHIDGTGRCRSRDEDDERCGCRAFENELENDNIED